MANITNVVAAQMEAIDKALPELLETSSYLYKELGKNAHDIKVSTRDLRIPVIVSGGGDFGTYDPDGGDMGLGSAPMWKVMTTTYFPFKHAIQLTDLEMETTKESEQALKSQFAVAVAKALPEFQAHLDASLHCPASGVVATAVSQTTTGGKTVYTLDDNVSNQLIRRNTPYVVYPTALDTARDSGNSHRAIAVDKVSNTVTMDATIASAANTDKLLFAGVAATSPTWANTIQTFLSTATTGNLLALDRAANPEVISNWVDAGASTISPLHGALLLKQIDQRIDKLESPRWIFHRAQVLGLQKQITTIQKYDVGQNTKILDLLPEFVDEFQFAGAPAKVDKHQDRSRVELLTMKNWGRAVVKDLGWRKNPDGRYFYELRGSSGGIGAGILLYMNALLNFYCVNPAAQGFIYNLNVNKTV